MLNPVFSRASRQGGSSLIEVLVAIIVLSVGMLSMLWAQTKSMGFERTAEFRNIAAQIASERGPDPCQPQCGEGGCSR